jgi:deoxyribodipyrimidine photo-lyase
MTETTLMWFRNDLRVADNPALDDAASRGSVVGVFLLADRQWQEHHVSARRLAFLKACLKDLRESLDALNIPLVITPASRFEEAPQSLLSIAEAWRATGICCNAEYPLNELRRDRAVARACKTSGLRFERHHGGVIVPPGTVQTATGTPYTVFTPFKKRWLDQLTPDDWTPLPRPAGQAAIKEMPDFQTRSDQTLDQLPNVEDAAWPGGEAESHRRLESFLQTSAQKYQIDRDLPAKPGTSQLSPYLSTGTISARSALAAARKQNNNKLNATPGAFPGLDTWISELIWREFYRHVTAAFPHISTGAAFRRETDQLKWRDDPEQFDRWCKGETGFPLVDAGMRQLNTTGWMHNRLRMVTAMFLSKHLLLDWRQGERYFMENLIDGDFAANNGGWQWSSSTGTDAAPYFRIFNPSSQAAKCDPTGEFIRQWVPETEGLLGADGTHPQPYPQPMVDHAVARERALRFFKRRS